MFRDSVGVEPVDELFLDGVAFGVIADERICGRGEQDRLTAAGRGESDLFYH